MHIVRRLYICWYIHVDNQFQLNITELVIFRSCQCTGSLVFNNLFMLFRSLLFMFMMIIGFPRDQRNRVLTQQGP